MSEADQEQAVMAMSLTIATWWRTHARNERSDVDFGAGFQNTGRRRTGGTSTSGP